MRPLRLAVCLFLTSTLVSPLAGQGAARDLPTTIREADRRSVILEFTRMFAP